VDDVTLLQGDCLDILPTLGAGSVDAIVTSPPYFHQRDYGHPSQIGLEETVAGYVASLVRVFTLASLTLKPTGTFWINLGDSFNGYFGNQRGTSLEETVQATRPKFPQGMGLRCKILKNKDLIGIPWRVAFALQESGLYLRSDNIWFKIAPTSMYSCSPRAKITTSIGTRSDPPSPVAIVCGRSRRAGHQTPIPPTTRSTWFARAC
jgi:DNA modification methylase